MERLTKEQAFSSGNNQDIIDFILLQNGINPETITNDEYDEYVKKIYEKLLAVSE
jgi:hypothetical protein